jgi:hypothetical protein
MTSPNYGLEEYYSSNFQIDQILDDIWKFLWASTALLHTKALSRYGIALILRMLTNAPQPMYLFLKLYFFD